MSANKSPDIKLTDKMPQHDNTASGQEHTLKHSGSNFCFHHLGHQEKHNEDHNLNTKEYVTDFQK